MVGPRVSQSSGHRRWKQWWRRSPNTCCSKKILLLLIWQVFFILSWCLLAYLPNPNHNKVVVFILTFLSYCFAPLVGWLADIRFGRYETIKFFSIASFLSSVLYYFAMITGGGVSTLSTVLLSIVSVILSFAYTCYEVAMLPFLTDQIIGASSDELSAVVCWYFWAENLGTGLAKLTAYNYFYKNSNLENISVPSTLCFAIPLAVIIISDCLCQQWLDRTHKVTNPIKLIIQVLNYTRKHSYPERRSAFTYIDEEQPSRMDYGKEKFGGPFTEEEVEDVKTFLRLLPLVICLSLYVSLEDSPVIYLLDAVLDFVFISWLFPVLLIPLYQLLLYRCFHNCIPSILQCIVVGFFMCTLGSILLSALGVVGVIVSDDVQRYLSCTVLAPNATNPGDYLELYWKLSPYILYGIGDTVVNVLLLELIIAQSPDKMKGLVMGIVIGFGGFVNLINIKSVQFTLCYLVNIISS